MKKVFKVLRKYKNVYIVFISLATFVSLIGNYYQDRFYNKAIEIQEGTIEPIEKEKRKLEEENRILNNKLKIITDEYSDLLEKSK